jgi:ribosome-binding ATPase
MAMERLGLLGLPNSGKSTLFNALTGGDAVVAPHPFSTTESTVGIATVPDDRLLRLSAMSQSKKTVHTGFEMVDIAALVKGANTGQGLGNRFLGTLREVDAILFVLRAFVDANVMGDSDPADDLETLEFELVVADLDMLTCLVERRRKAAKTDKSLVGEVEVMDRAIPFLQAGTPLYRAAALPTGGLSADDIDVLRKAFVLTAKPTLVVVNIGDDQIEQSDAIAAPFGPDAVAACLQLEMEASRLDPSERTELLEGLGLGEGVVPRVARSAYHLLGRRTFFTTGDKESRAWTFRAGAKAPECAGVIHSDLQRGFIRAEVIRWDELLEIGSWTKAKDVGKLRVEGKDYFVDDGDVLEIRFNV